MINKLKAFRQMLTREGHNLVRYAGTDGFSLPDYVYNSVKNGPVREIAEQAREERLKEERGVGPVRAARLKENLPEYNPDPLIIRTLQGHGSRPVCLKISRDGRFLASGDRDGVLCFWNVGTGDCLRRIENGYDGSLVLSTDEKRIFSGRRIFDRDTGELLGTIGDPGSRIETLSADGIRAAGYNRKSGYIEVFNPEEKRRILTLRPHRKLDFLYISRDGNILVFGTSRTAVSHCAYDMGESLFYYSPVYGDGKNRCNDYNGEGLLASGDSSGLIHLYDVMSRTELTPLEGHTGPVLSLSFTEDGTKLISLSGSRELKLWDIDDGSCFKSERVPFSQCTSVVLDGSGKVGVAASSGGALYVMDTERGMMLDDENESGIPVASILPVPESGKAVSVTEEGVVTLTAFEQGSVEDQQTLQETGHIRECCGRGSLLCILGDRGSVSEDGGLHWNTLPDSENIVTAVPDPGDRGLYYIGSSGRLLYYSSETGDSQHILAAGKEGIRRFVTAPDGRLAVVAKDEVILGVDLETGERFGEIPVPADSLRMLMSLPDGTGFLYSSSEFVDGGVDGVGDVPEDNSREMIAVRLFADMTRDLFTLSLPIIDTAELFQSGEPAALYGFFGCSDGFLYILDLSSGSFVWKSEGHSGAFTCCTPVPGGRYLLTGSNDNSVKIWDLKEKRLISTVVMPGAGGVSSLLYEQGTLVCGDTNGNTFLYTLPLPEYGGPGVPLIPIWSRNRSWWFPSPAYRGDNAGAESDASAKTVAAAGHGGGTVPEENTLSIPFIMSCRYGVPLQAESDSFDSGSSRSGEPLLRFSDREVPVPGGFEGEQLVLYTSESGRMSLRKKVGGDLVRYCVGWRDPEAPLHISRDGRFAWSLPRVTPVDDDDLPGRGTPALRRWDLSTGVYENLLWFDESPDSFSISPDNRYGAFFWSNDCLFSVYDLPNFCTVTDDLLEKISGGRVESVLFAGDCRRLLFSLSGEGRSLIKVYEIRDVENDDGGIDDRGVSEIKQLPGKGRLFPVPDERYIISSDSPCQFRLWNIDTGVCEAYYSHTAPLTGIDAGTGYITAVDDSGTLLRFRYPAGFTITPASPTVVSYDTGDRPRKDDRQRRVLEALEESGISRIYLPGEDEGSAGEGEIIRQICTLFSSEMKNRLEKLSPDQILVEPSPSVNPVFFNSGGGSFNGSSLSGYHDLHHRQSRFILFRIAPSGRREGNGAGAFCSLSVDPALLASTGGPVDDRMIAAAFGKAWRTRFPDSVCTPVEAGSRPPSLFFDDPSMRPGVCASVRISAVEAAGSVTLYCPPFPLLLYFDEKVPESRDNRDREFYPGRFVFRFQIPLDRMAHIHHGCRMRIINSKMPVLLEHDDGLRDMYEQEILPCSEKSAVVEVFAVGEKYDDDGTQYDFAGDSAARFRITINGQFLFTGEPLHSCSGLCLRISDLRLMNSLFHDSGTKAGERQVSPPKEVNIPVFLKTGSEARKATHEMKSGIEGRNRREQGTKDAVSLIRLMSRKPQVEMLASLEKRNPACAKQFMSGIYMADDLLTLNRDEMKHLLNLIDFGDLRKVIRSRDPDFRKSVSGLLPARLRRLIGDDDDGSSPEDIAQSERNIAVQLGKLYLMGKAGSGK